MRGFLRWTGRILGGLLVLLLLAATVVYALSARILTAPRGVDGVTFAIPDDSASIAEGERLAHIRGCPGCHGPDLAGQVFVDDPVLGRLTAPGLPEVARTAPPQRLERAIRRGIGLDGRALLAMPSEMYFDVSDADLGRIVAWVRSLRPEEPALPGRSLRLARAFIVSGRFQPAHAYVGPERARMEPPAADDTLRVGEYIARTSCPECHGLALGGDGTRTPGLAIAAGYTPEEWETFLSTGTAKGGRELELMSDVARFRLSHLTPYERTALRAYLATLGEPAR
ncbi:MAG TPA: c-type cytochrome [Gemmatimonadales bacterium]|nr:c-type cytochrome [Gemmatimonadales bacterium]